MTKPVFVGAAPWAATGVEEQKYGLFRSDVGGEWASLTRGLPEQVEIRALTANPHDADTVYAATHKGPYRSTDGGDSWTSMGLDDAHPTWSITVHPQDPKIIYAGTVDARVYRSTDGGDSWSPFTMQMPEGACIMNFPTRMLRIALDPSNPEEIYVALEVAGLVRSLDDGRTWTSCNADLLEMAKQDRYKSRISSDTDTEGMMDSHALVVSQARPGTVFLANRMGVFRSPDRGESWADLDIGQFSPLTYSRDICVSPHDANTLLGAFSGAAVSDAGSLYRSTDLGESWQQYDQNVSMNSTLMTTNISASSDQRVYCAARRGQVFGTEDGGVSWTQSQLPSGVEGVYAVLCM
jgi:photosystem II stability/assembly factor-like uncharacterized protein